MLGMTPKVIVHLCDGVTDLRKSYEGLKAVLKEKTKADPLGGHLFVFSNRTRTRIKTYQWDGTGEVICMKKLHSGTFRWPEKGAVIDMAALQALLAGYEIRTRRGWYRHGTPIYDIDSQQDTLTPP
jgi:transposase